MLCNNHEKMTATKMGTSLMLKALSNNMHFAPVSPSKKPWI